MPWSDRDELAPHWPRLRLKALRCVGFTPEANAEEWCERRLLSRIHNTRSSSEQKSNQLQRATLRFVRLATPVR
jgi:hypothetical protein